ncbi:MAG: hypothetical protein RL701_4679, partial [Pseudomonadota bacterium]
PRYMPEYREFDIYDRSKHITFGNPPTSAEQLVADGIAARVVMLVQSLRVVVESHGSGHGSC